MTQLLEVSRVKVEFTFPRHEVSAGAWFVLMTWEDARE
jgi:hypothetical protein